MADLAYWEVYHSLAKSEEEFLELSVRWVYVYNVLRPHTGVVPWLCLRDWYIMGMRPLLSSLQSFWTGLALI